MSNTCLTKSLVYKADISTDKDDAKVYIGKTRLTHLKKISEITQSLLRTNAMEMKQKLNVYIKLQELNVPVLEIHLLSKKLLVIVANITDQPCQCDDPSLFPLGTLI